MLNICIKKGSLSALAIIPRVKAGCELGRSMMFTVSIIAEKLKGSEYDEIFKHRNHPSSLRT